MIADGDENLRRRFRELKDHDRRRARPFDAVMASSRELAARRERRRPIRLAAAVLLLLAGAATVALVRLHRPQPELVAIGSWRSPTEFLLQRPGAALLDSVPGVAASNVRLERVLEVNTTSRRSGQHKGDTI
jgi:hypothetical protein